MYCGVTLNRWRACSGDRRPGAGAGPTVGAEVKQVVLHALQPGREGVGQAGRQERDAERRVELVERAVGLDARVLLDTRLMSPRWVSPASPSLV